MIWNSVDSDWVGRETVLVLTLWWVYVENISLKYMLKLAIVEAFNASNIIVKLFSCLSALVHLRNVPFFDVLYINIAKSNPGVAANSLNPQGVLDGWKPFLFGITPANLVFIESSDAKKNEVHEFDVHRRVCKCTQGHIWELFLFFSNVFIPGQGKQILLEVIPHKRLVKTDYGQRDAKTAKKCCRYLFCV